MGPGLGPGRNPGPRPCRLEDTLEGVGGWWRCQAPGPGSGPGEMEDELESTAELDRRLEADGCITWEGS